MDYNTPDIKRTSFVKTLHRSELRETITLKGIFYEVYWIAYFFDKKGHARQWVKGCRYLNKDDFYNTMDKVKESIIKSYKNHEEYTNNPNAYKVCTVADVEKQIQKDINELSQEEKNELFNSEKD